MVEEADYKGYHIRVVCGYNVIMDNFLVHAYVSPPSGPEVSVFNPPIEDTHMDDALDHGFAKVICEVDQLVTQSK